MTSIKETIRRYFENRMPLPPGTYHYQAPLSDPNNYRLHLRLEQDGSGILIVNASTVLHLNQTAAEFAFYLVQNLPEEQAVQNVARRYRVSKDQARHDYHSFFERIDTLIKTPDLDPVTYLNFERTRPFSEQISAPYRLDCALTYRLVTEVPGIAPVERVERELNTEEWKTVLDKAWAAGIPHVVFTGGEPTLRGDLLELIAHTEQLGMVAGLLTDGLRLIDSGYLQELLLTGLDHITLVLQPELEQPWIVLERVLAEDIHTVVHLTITSHNRTQMPALLKRLAEKGVQKISLSASPDLEDDLEQARELEANLALELVWNLPVPYSQINPLNLETENQEVREGAGKAWLYVEPDGDVLPSQGMQPVLGNILNEPWDDIWQKAQA
jgi:organic radical activating enzyme